MVRKRDFFLFYFVRKVWCNYIQIKLELLSNNNQGANIIKKEKNVIDLMCLGL